MKSIIDDSQAIETQVDYDHKMFNRLIKEGITPLADEIMKIWKAEQLPVLFFEVGLQKDDGSAPAAIREMSRVAKASCEDLGWKGERIKLGFWNKAQARKLAKTLEKSHPLDKAAAWLRHWRVGRLFLFTGFGTLCLNCVKGSGWQIEPGTLESEWRN